MCWNMRVYTDTMAHVRPKHFQDLVLRQELTAGADGRISRELLDAVRVDGRLMCNRWRWTEKAGQDRRETGLKLYIDTVASIRCSQSGTSIH